MLHFRPKIVHYIFENRKQLSSVYADSRGLTHLQLSNSGLNSAHTLTAGDLMITTWFFHKTGQNLQLSILSQGVLQMTV